MNQDKIVVINGRRYDAKTGLPLPSDDKPSNDRATRSSRVHSSVQRSKTLIRRVTKKPTSPNKPTGAKHAGRIMDFAKSSKVSHFAPHHKPNTDKKPATKQETKGDISPQRHPMVDRAVANISSTVKPIQKTATEIKNEAISSALAQNSIAIVKKSFFGRHPRSVVIISISIIVTLIGAYLTYVNMPNLSVKFASMQAGIDATYPEYRPDGFSLSGPVTYSDGEVVISFKANTGSKKFTLRQTRSSWDSTAVLDNIVRKQAGEEYITSQENGLTIYTFGGNGAWVNDGILYTIDDEGEPPLSGDKIRRIAISM